MSSTLTEDQRMDAVASMCAAMYRRGPDGVGVRDFGAVCLGMRRLSIIDTSSRGQQPMPSYPQRSWFVFNGEIYNFQEERQRLQAKGYAFRSRTDTETIVNLYEENGLESVERLRGMFAFAIFDLTTRELVLGRDRLGIKPLYWFQRPGLFVFASEIKALLASGLVDAKLACQQLDLYLACGYVPAPKTLVENVYALLPGHTMTVRDQTISTRRYWEIPREGSICRSPSQAVSEARHLLEESVRLHQISDVPLGAFLSGGIDSSAVVGLMSRQVQQPIRTFTVGFDDAPGFSSELQYARSVARQNGTNHTEVTLSGRDVAAHLGSVIEHIDQPSADAINTYFVSRAAREGGVTVALSGLGGDELFGGYGTYRLIPRWAKYASFMETVPLSVRQCAGQLLSYLGKMKSTGGRWHKMSRIAHVSSPLSLYGLARLLLWPHERKPLFLNEMRNEVAPVDRMFPSVHLPDSEESLWQTVTRLEMSHFMGYRLLRDTDVMSMAHSLEVRVPLLDHKLVEFVTGLDRTHHAHVSRPKYILTEALRGIIPEEIISRPKRGFEFPMSLWMKTVLRDVVEDVFSEEVLRSRSLFSRDEMKLLYLSFLKGHQDYQVIWQFVVLELWMRRYLDGQPRRIAAGSFRTLARTHSAPSW
jgi:asparagine synthase (glutamine-hydrolysing)